MKDEKKLHTLHDGGTGETQEGSESPEDSPNGGQRGK
jgi:hypothetical protein